MVKPKLAEYSAMIVADAGNEFLLLVGRLHSDFDEFEAVSRGEKRQLGRNAASSAFGVDNGAVARRLA